MKNYRYLLFDLDNTLFDFDRAEETAFTAAFSAYGLPCDTDIYRLYHEINDRLWKQLERGEVQRDRLRELRFEQLLDQLGIPDADNLSGRLNAEYFEQLSHQRILLPGALDVCAKLNRYYRLFIITNGYAYTQQGRYFGSEIEQYFEDIFISEKVGSAKPSTAYFDYVMAAAGDSDISAYCVIGDSLSSDIAGAAAAGMDAVWLNRGGRMDASPYPIRHMIHDIRELPDYLLNM